MNRPILRCVRPSWLLGGSCVVMAVAAVSFSRVGLKDSVWDQPPTTVPLSATAVSWPTTVPSPVRLPASWPSSFSRQEDGPRLRWKFEEGQVYRFDMQQTVNISTMVARNPQKKIRSSEQRVIVQLKVLQSEQESAKLEFRYLQFSFALETDGSRATASTNPDETPVGSGGTARLVQDMVRGLEPLLDQPLILTVDPLGNIESLEVDKVVVDTILAAPNTMALRENLSQEGIEKVLGTFLVPLSENAERSWKRTTKLEIGDTPVTQTTTYSIDPDVSESDKTVSIHFESSVNFPVEKLEAASHPDQLKNQDRKDNPPPFDFDPVAEKWPRVARQESKGDITFDAAQGYATNASARQVLVTEKAQSNFLIETTIETKTQVDITRSEAR